MSDKLLHRLNFDGAYYVEKQAGLFIPFNLHLPELRLRTYLLIPCFEKHSDAILYALKEEMKKDG